MDHIDSHELSLLLTPQSGPCVSVYLSTHAAGEAGQQDRPRLKNLLDQAEEQLIAGGMRSSTARDLLLPPRQLPEDASFWKARSEGLAIFVSPGFQRYCRLHVAFDELAIVGPRFIVRPMLPLLGRVTRFYVLALSQNKVQFFEADQQRMNILELPDVPTDMETALHYTSVDRGAQAHSAMQGRLGKQAAVFHGQGGEPDTRKEELETFFRQIDKAVISILEKDGVPLLLAGVDYLLPIYRQVSRYKNISEPEVHGNCDYLAPHEIHERAWQAIEPVLAQGREKLGARLRAAVATDKAIMDFRKILVAANEGRVEALFIDQSAQCWGHVRREFQDVEIHDRRQPGDDDLVDLAAIETLRHGGKIFAVPFSDMPTTESTAALLRY